MTMRVGDGGGSNFGSKRAAKMLARAHASINFDYSEKLSIIMNKWNKWGMPFCELGARNSRPHSLRCANIVITNYFISPEVEKLQ